MRLIHLALPALALAGCSPTGPLLNRAQLDLNCSKDKIKIVELGPDRRSIKGCGRRATYVYTCDPNKHCLWVPQAEEAPPKK